MINLPPRYRTIVKTLNGGGMSDTVLCEDSNLSRQVVVKSLKRGIEPRRLLDELSALSAIRSRYVVQVYDVVRDSNDDIVAFVEEYLSGAELLPCHVGASGVDALKALYPICAGISEIHAHDLIHRDLKPDNMKFDANGQLKIFDFGLAKLSTSSGTASLYFTRGYTPPEVFKATPAGIFPYAPPVDVFAFGCVAIWMLNGGNLPAELYDMPPNLPIPGFSFRNLQASVPSSIANLLQACIDPNPSFRPPISTVKAAIADELLRDQHKLLLTYNGKENFVDSTNRTANLSWNGNMISVGYDGIRFTVTGFSGTVMINNSPAQIGQRLTGACVIVFGQGGGVRASVPCALSHPEVTL